MVLAARLCLLLAAMPMVAIAQTWAFVNFTENHLVFVDTTSIEKDGARLTARVLYDLRKPGTYMGKPYNSSVQQDLFDCGSEESATRHEVMYGGHAGTGSVVWSGDADKEQMSGFRPGSVGAFVVHAVCGLANKSIKAQAYRQLVMKDDLSQKLVSAPTVIDWGRSKLRIATVTTNFYQQPGGNDGAGSMCVVVRVICEEGLIGSHSPASTYKDPDCSGDAIQWVALPEPDTVFHRAADSSEVSLVASVCAAQAEPVPTLAKTGKSGPEPDRGAPVLPEAGASTPESEDMLDDESIKALLDEVSGNLRPSLPRMVDKETRLESATPGPGRRMTYLYTLVYQPAAEVEAARLRDKVSPSLVARACSPDAQLFIQNGVTWIFRYQGNDGRQIATVSVSPEDCKAATRDVPPPARRPGHRDATACLKYAYDPSRLSHDTIRNDCGFGVMVSFCWLGVPDTYLSCDKKEFGARSIAPGESAEIPLRGPEQDSRRIAWVACESPGIPRKSWNGSRVVNAGCTQ